MKNLFNGIHPITKILLQKEYIICLCESWAEDMTIIKSFCRKIRYDVCIHKVIFLPTFMPEVCFKIFLQKKTQTCKQEYASARDIKPQRGFKKEKYNKVEYAQPHVCLFYLQSSLHENVVFSVCAHIDNAAYIMFIM